MESKIALWWKKHRHDLITVLVISFTAALSYGFITPLDTVLSNQNEFLISFYKIAQSIIMPACELFLTLLMVFAIAALIHRNVLRVLSAVLLGIVGAMYCQELFLNGKVIHGINGNNLDSYTDFYASVNVFIHSMFILLPVALTIRQIRNGNQHEKQQKHEDMEPSFFARNIIAILFVGITVMKLAGFASSYTKYNPKKYINNNIQSNEDNLKALSFEPTTVFSQNKNIIVFIVDRFDGLWCDEFMELYPEISQELEGFTYYQNNVSQYTNTFPSMCNMLTHQQYDGSEWTDYFEKSWAEENVPSLLKENDYQVNLLLDQPTTYGAMSRIEPYCDNYLTIPGLTATVNEKKLGQIVHSLMLTRVLPYYAKECIPSTQNNISDLKYFDFTYDGEYKNFSMGIVDPNTDTDLYFYLKNANFQSSSSKNVFTMIHLNGAHDTNDDLIHMTGEENGSVIQRTIRANFEIILKYINSAKKLGVYDKTTFVIMGDHGRIPESVIDSHLNMQSPIITALLIKPANAKQSDLIYDTNTGLSNSMFGASVLQYAGIDHQDFGYSYQDIIESGQDVPRDFQHYQWSSIGSVRFIEGFNIEGNARDFNNWKRYN